MCGNGLQQSVYDIKKLTGENYFWTLKLNYGHVSCHYQACFEIRLLATHWPQGPKQIRKHQCKSTSWIWAKKECQLISEENLFKLDPLMGEPRVDLKGIRDIPSKAYISLQ